LVTLKSYILFFVGDEGKILMKRAEPQGHQAKADRGHSLEARSAQWQVYPWLIKDILTDFRLKKYLLSGANQFLRRTLAP
jgi:hypothetical protein